MPVQEKSKPIKRASPKNPSHDNNLNTVKQVEDRWSKFFSSGVTGSYNPIAMQSNIFSNDPYLLNQRIKQLKTSPILLSRDEIESALVNQESNERTLRTATQSMFRMTYPLYRLQMMYEGILTYKSLIRPLYVDKKEMSTNRFKSDWKFVDMWQKKLNPQKQFRRIVSEVLPEGKRAYYLRQNYNSTTGKEEVGYVHFQDLPSDWYKIIKHSTDSYAVVAFNFSYFWMAGTSLSQYPPEFAKYYEELMFATTEDSTGRKIINPNLVPDDVTLEYNSTEMKWYYWKEMPSDQCFVFSFTEADDLQVSPFTSLLLQAQDLSSYALLQQQLLSVPLYSMLLGEIPLQADNNKSGAHIDDFTLSPEAVNSFENKINGSMPPGTSFFMTPSSKNNLFRFEAVPNANEIYDKGLQQMINTSGASTLMTTTSKPSVAQVNAGKIIETRYIDRIYSQFALAVNITLNNMYNNGDLKFQWFFEIFGDSFSEKEQIASLEKALSLGQIELLPEYLAYRNKSLMDAVQNADWVNSCGIYDLFKPLVNTFGMSGDDKVNGRPKADENNIQSDSTASSIDGGTNVKEGSSVEE